MASADQGDDSRKPAQTPAERAKLERRAEALRANLKRRKAQTRARDEAQRDAPASGSD